jgi:hypothetical protein
MASTLMQPHKWWLHGVSNSSTPTAAILKAGICRQKLGEHCKHHDGFKKFDSAIADEGRCLHDYLPMKVDRLWMNQWQQLQLGYRMHTLHTKDGRMAMRRIRLRQS